MQPMRRLRGFWVIGCLTKCWRALMEIAEDRLLRRRDAATYLGLSLSGLAHMKCRKAGPPFRMIGNRAWYLQSDLDKWAAAQIVEQWPADFQRLVRRAARQRRLRRWA
jgi:hypothetical protein